MRTRRNREALPAIWRVQPEGPWVKPLRKGRYLTWVRICAVLLDEKGCDRLGRYQGRTGVAIYAIEYPDGTYSYFRTNARYPALMAMLKRQYPKAKIEISNVRGLCTWTHYSSSAFSVVR